MAVIKRGSRVMQGVNLEEISLIAEPGVPVNGTGGVLAGIAAPGTLLLDTTNFQLYVNAGTLASPVWKQFTRAA